MKDKHINELVKQYIEEFEEKTGAKVVYVTKSGSKLYGTDTEKSDTDYKGIFIPSKESVLLKQDIPHYIRDTNNTNKKNTSEDIDFSIHSIYNFMELLKKSETGAVDVMFSMFRKDTIVFQDYDFTNTMKKNLKYFLNRNMKSFIGYSLGQTKKFGIKGARYDELNSFVKEIKETEKISKKGLLIDQFENFKKICKEQNFKYIKFVLANGPRGTGTNNKIEYISVLGKLFEGRVTLEYFLERINLLYSQFGNRTKSIAKTESNKEIIKELKLLKGLVI